MAELVTGLTSGAAYALMAVGVVLIFRSTGALSVAQGEIGAFGLFVSLQWAKDGVPGLGWHLPRVMTLVVAVVIGAVIGLVAERVVMRPLVRRPPLDALIATLGIALVLALLEIRIFGATLKAAPALVGEWDIQVLGATLQSSRVVGIVLTAAVAGALYLFFSRTKLGLGVRATTSDPTVARLLGVPVNQVYRFAWVTAGALSGVAAALLAPAFGALVPFGQTGYAMRALAGAVIGGLDSVWGAIVGCLLVGAVEGVIGPRTADGVDSLAVLALVLLTLLLRPRGLFGATAAA